MSDSKETANSQTAPPSQSFLRRLEIATIDKASELLGLPEKPKGAKLVKLTPEQADELRRIEDDAMARFAGDLTVLEAALGMLRMGHHFGWRVLYLMHSKKTIRHYEEILDIEVRTLFDDTGPSSYRSIGFALAQKFSNFWKVAGGDIKIPRRKDAVD
jgi:hypothetical protein